MASQASVFDPFNTKPQETPKKVKTVGGTMGFYDGETESETPLGSNTVPDTFYEVFKDAPFNLFDPSHPETETSSSEIQPTFLGHIDFEDHNRVAQEAQRVNELRTEIADSSIQIIIEEKVEATIKPQISEQNKFDLSEVGKLKEYIKFGEFFKIVGGESMFGFQAIKSLIIENILPPKKNPKAEAIQNMTPEQYEQEKKKQSIYRNKKGFFAQLRSFGGNLGIRRALENKGQNINSTVGLNTAFEGSIDKQTGEVRIDLQILAEKKNSEMNENELKAKKQQQMAAVTGSKSLRTHMGAQEGQSIVANAVATAG